MLTLVGLFVSMVGFGILHSLTADHRFKAWVQRRIGERAYEGFYRLVYNVVALLMLLPIALLMSAGEQTVWVMPDWLRPVLLVIQIAGFVGLAISLLQIDWLRFAGLRQVWAYLRGDPLPLPPEPLQTHGVYAIVRHPLYLFSMMALWAVPTMSDSYLVFVIMATLYFIIGSWVEEWRMVRYFGAEYEAYQARVPRLIPRFHRLVMNSS